MWTADLSSRFDHAVRAVGGTLPTEAAYAALAARYRQPHRCYHGLDHVAACLAWLERVREDAERPEEIALALFFHDAVQDRGLDDEERSAMLAEHELAALGVPGEACRRIGTLVHATAGHHASEGDAALVVDVDLAILAAPPDAYARYVAGVRAEHPHLSDAAFRAGRAAFARAFLERAMLFHTSAFRALEPLARQNLAAELRALDAAREVG